MQLDPPQVDGALAAAVSRRDDDLHGRALAQPVVRRGPPGELELPLLDAHALPLVREREVAALEPPDVVAARVEQLELKIVDARVTADFERKLVIVGKPDRQRAARDGVARGAREVELQA
jgi:hypothetical protein